jgi:hypothetical protein
MAFLQPENEPTHGNHKKDMGYLMGVEAFGCGMGLGGVAAIRKQNSDD